MKKITTYRSLFVFGITFLSGNYFASEQSQPVKRKKIEINKKAAFATVKDMNVVVPVLFAFSAGHEVLLEHMYGVNKKFTKQALAKIMGRTFLRTGLFAGVAAFPLYHINKGYNKKVD